MFVGNKSKMHEIMGNVLSVLSTSVMYFFMTSLKREKIEIYKSNGSYYL